MKINKIDLAAIILLVLSVIFLIMKNIYQYGAVYKFLSSIFVIFVIIFLLLIIWGFWKIFSLFTKKNNFNYSESDLKTGNPVLSIAIFFTSLFIFWMGVIQFSFSDPGLGGVFLIFPIGGMIIFGINSISIHYNRIKKKTSDFSDKFFLYIIIIGFMSPFIGFFCGYILIRFIRKILSLLFLPESFLYSNYFFIICSIILLLILGFLAYVVAMWNDLKFKKIGRVIVLVIFLFFVFAIIDNQIEHAKYNCKTGEQCLNNRAIYKNDLAECIGFFVSGGTGDVYKIRERCIDNFLDKKEIKPADCLSLNDKQSLQDYCIKRAFVGFKPITYSDANSCEILDERLQLIVTRDSCYSNLAVNLRDINICNKIEKISHVTICKDNVYAKIAFDKSDLNVCDNIVYYPREKIRCKNNIYAYLAIEQQDVNQCDNIISIDDQPLDISDKVNCKNRIYFHKALDQLSTTFCDYIYASEEIYNSTQIKKMCYESIFKYKDIYNYAFNSRNPDYCDYIISETNYSSFYYPDDIMDKLKAKCKANANSNK